MNYLKPDDLEAYQNAFKLSNYIWDIAINFNDFTKYTIGKQIVNSIDSISANIVEGFGRYHKKEKIRFYMIARGSLLETIDWTKKLFARELISKEQYEHINYELEILPKSINSLISYTENKLKY